LACNQLKSFINTHFTPKLALRYFFHIAFNGTQYRGWQRQSNANTIQQEIETSLGKILKKEVNVSGCGRTDAHVHASQFFFHLNVTQPWDFDMQFRLNKMLPSDIAVFDIIEVGDHQHAQFDTRQRTYDYFIHHYKDPFLDQFSAWYPKEKLKLNEMKKALAILLKYQDYRAFCKSPDLYEHTICKVTTANLYLNEQENRIRFEISADRFLWRMVRLLAGNLLQIGKGEMSVDEFENLFITRTTPKIWNPAYPQGLFLSKVTYPYLDLPMRASLITHAQPKEQWQKL
jgi:tRNA pseudouridine38-40 synthase